MGDGVLGELGERLVDPLALRVELALQLLDPERAPAEDLRPPASTAPPSIVTRSPSLSSSKGSPSSTSTSMTPAWASSSGPAFG